MKLQKISFEGRIKILSVVFIMITSLAIALIFYYPIDFMFNQQIKESEAFLYQKQKDAIKQNVLTTASLVQHATKQTHLVAKQRIKARIDLAQKLVTNLYETNKNHLTKPQLKTLIIKTLRQLYFDSNVSLGQNYYFIQEVHSQDTIIAKLLPSTPHYENLNNAFFKDAQGKLLVQEFYEICSSKGEGFSTYYWNKRKGNSLQQYPKLSYVTLFQPFNWIIGYGEYLDDIEDEIKANVIQTISNLKYSPQEENYIFVYELQNINGGKQFAKMLINPNRPDLIGKYLDDDVKDPNGFEYRKQFLKDIRNNGESFVEYAYKKPKTDATTKKISYFYHQKDWNWIIAQGVYLDTITNQIASLHQEKNTQTNAMLIKTILFTALFTLLLSLFSYFIFRKLHQYQEKEKQQQALIEQQSKLASMGEMIGNIAHQWRQPLNTICSIASGVKMRDEFAMPQESLPKDMDTIVIQTQYLSKTIDDFRNFIRPNQPKEHLSIILTVNKALAIVSPTLTNHNIVIEFTHTHDIVLDGYQNELIQALINFINNAKDAIEEHQSSIDNKVILITIDHNILSIQDSGGGIAPQIINRIFEPYFTTKNNNSGTGIGLSMAYQIITHHHEGTIQIENRDFEYKNKKLHGALFCIEFNSYSDDPTII